MRVLLVDIGNTRIKWALWRDGRLSPQQALEHEGGTKHDFAAPVFRRARGLDRIAVVSVGGEALDRKFAAEAQRATGRVPEFVATSRSAAGVTTRYTEPWRLGVDRFVAAVGGHYLARSRPVCIIDVGTAMTVDLVSSDGVHHGGAIVPGPQLMVNSLLRNTSGIGKRAQGGKGRRGLFARNTRSAIEQGALYMVAAMIDRAHEESRRTLGRTPLVLLTGGAAGPLQPFLQRSVVSVPDLVLRGLAVLIGLQLH